MAVHYYGGYDFGRLGTFSASFQEGGGPVAITFATGRYAHRDFSSVLGTNEYAGFGPALKAALDASALAGTFTVSWSSSTYWTISSTVNFSIPTWNTLGGNILGLTGGTFASAASHSSFLVPHYFFNATIPSRSNNPNSPREPDAIAEDAEAGESTSYGVCSPDVPSYRAWVQMFEPKTKALKQYAPVAAAGVATWTMEHLFEHCRNVEPFGVEDTFGNGVHKLRAHACTKNEITQAVGNQDTYWHTQFATRYLGAY